MLQKRNLIIGSVGDGSQHTSWLSGRKKDFDLMLIYYGNAKSRYKEDADYYLHIQGRFKFETIAAAINELPDVIQQYDAVCLPDDDVVASADIINALFAIFHKHNLDLAHPSVNGGVFYNRDILQHRKAILRYVDFVDRICPLFKIEALLKTLSTFTLNRSGWGIELVWGKILKDKKIAIIDSVAVTHRPSRLPSWEREYYKRLAELKIDPYDELAEIERQYGVSPHNPILHGVRRKSRLATLFKIFITPKGISL